MLSRPIRGAWIEISSRCSRGTSSMSRPIRGAWIEIMVMRRGIKDSTGSRPIRGAWIEINEYLTNARINKSRPIRGAWIEIASPPGCAQGGGSRAPYGARGLKSHSHYKTYNKTRRAPYGARGLKLRPFSTVLQGTCRAPYGARGLKFSLPDLPPEPAPSRPIRGAWIEIPAPSGRGR